MIACEYSLLSQNANTSSVRICGDDRLYLQTIMTLKYAESFFMLISSIENE